MPEVNMEKTFADLRTHFGSDWPIIQDYMCSVVIAFEELPESEKNIWSDANLWNAAQLAKLLADIDCPEEPHAD